MKNSPPLRPFRFAKIAERVPQKPRHYGVRKIAGQWHVTDAHGEPVSSGCALKRTARIRRIRHIVADLRDASSPLQLSLL